MKDFYNPPRQKPNISINGDKGMYNCDCRDKNGNGIKFKINCEQVPFTQGVVPKPGKVGVFYDPDTNKNERPKSNCRKRRRNDDDQDYIPSAIELQKANNEQMESNKKNKSIPERRVEMYVTPLTEQATKFGKALYDLAQTGHTFVLIKDGENEFVVESNPDDQYHNKVTITPLKEFNFPKKYYKAMTVKLPDNITAEDIKDNITMDKGQYDLLNNNCYFTVKEALKKAGASKRDMRNF